MVFYVIGNIFAKMIINSKAMIKNKDYLCPLLKIFHFKNLSQD